MADSEYAKMVNFEYCKTCNHWTKKETEAPCYDCLDTASREGTDVPIHWEEKEKV